VREIHNIVHLGVREMQAVFMKVVTKKEWKRKKTVLSWYSLYQWQKARNNARPPENAKLRWKAILSVLDPAFSRFH